METQEKFKALLNAAKAFQKKHNANSLTDVNLFSILKMENKEVSAHSALLYYVFKPFETEGQVRDDKHLRILLKCFGYDETAFEYVDLQREVVTDFGRLDFLIVADGKELKKEKNYVVELKIWANEQPAQISRYQRYLQSRGADGEVLFLTPTEREAQTGDEPVQNVTLGNEVKAALQEIIALRADKADYCAVLRQYISIIDKLTGGEVMDSAELLQSAEDILAVDSLVEGKKQALQKLLCAFFDRLKEGLLSPTATGNALTAENCPEAALAETDYAEQAKRYYGQDKPSYPALVFEIPNFRLKNCDLDLKDYGLYFYVEISYYLYAGLALRKKQPRFGHIDEALAEKLKPLSPKASETFLDWEYVKPNGKLCFKYVNGSESWIKQVFLPDSLAFDGRKMEQIVREIKNIYQAQCGKYLENTYAD